VDRVLITGAAGRIGSVLREGLRGQFDRLRLADLRELGPAADGEELVRLDLADLDGVVEAMDGMDGVVHLAAVPTEDAFEPLLRNNVLATYNVFEAARLQGVRRVVFASTNHVTGFYPRSRRVGPDDPVRPDTLYGVTKVFGEALGRLYADKFDLEVICLRIGAFSQRPPSARRERSLWLSHRDAVQLTIKALTAEAFEFLIVYGVSANPDSWYHNPAAVRLGYEPRDVAQQPAPEPAPRPAARPRRRSETLQGGTYTDHDFGRRERT
jgi:uronate dehydrogenase